MKKQIYFAIFLLLIFSSPNLSFAQETKHFNPDRLLFNAVKNGDIQQVKYAVSNGADVNTEDQYGFTPLYAASTHGYLKICKLLIANGATWDKPLPHYGYPVTMAVVFGHLDIVRYFIEKKGFPVNRRDKELKTLLHWAAGACHEEILGYLIKKGAFIDAKDEEGLTPLFYAANARDFKSFKHLIKHGAKADIQVPGYGYPVRLAIAPVFYTLYPLDSKVNFPLTQLCPLENKLKIVKYCIKKLGFDVNKKDYYGATLLHYAVDSKNMDIIKFLIKTGADLNAKDRYGQPPLHWAAQKGKAEICKILIDHGADVNAKDNYGETPLAIAEQNNKTEVIELLNKYGAKE